MSDDWRLSGGPERPLWEPVRLVDFADKRLEALSALRAKLREMPLADMTDENLVMHAILEQLFTNATVRVDYAKAASTRLATQALPKPPKGRRKRLTADRRADILVMVGRMWSIFITHNFPLNQPEMLASLDITIEPEA